MLIVVAEDTPDPSLVIREAERTGQRVGAFGYDCPIAGAAMESRSLCTERSAIDYLEAQGIDPVVARIRNGKVVRHPAPRKSAPIDGAELVQKGTRRDAGGKQCDVLSLLYHEKKSWVEYRAGRMEVILRRSGISHDYLLVDDHNEVGAIHEAIARSGCKLVLNELCHGTAEAIGELAARFPEVKFVAVAHCSPTYPAGQKDWSARVFDHQVLSTRAENCYLATVMDAERFDDMPGAKVISLPNFMLLPDPPKRRKRPKRPPSLSMVGRWDAVKGFPSAVSAACRIKDCHLIVISESIRHHFPYMQSKLAAAGVSAHFLPWMSHQSVMSCIDQFVDIGLQPSLSESFNLVALEHLYYGKPVIGSPAIEFLPKDWQVNPQDPGAIAKKAKQIDRFYRLHSWRARKIADRVIYRSNRSFLSQIKALLS